MGDEVVDLDVLISPEEASAVVEKYVSDKLSSAGLVDRFVRKWDVHTSVTLVFDKISFLGRDWASLTVTIDNFVYRTHVHAVVSGMDWSDKFLDCVTKALAQYKI